MKRKKSNNKQVVKAMTKAQISQLFRALGAKGGRAAAASMTATERKERARKASAAAAKVRSAKAKTKGENQ